MTEAPFRFKHVRGGKPIAPSEVPKLPPAAARLILRTQREKPNVEDIMQTLTDLGIGIVTLCLRRLDSSLTEQLVAEDEDYAETMRLYRYIQRQNPELFPPITAKATDEPEVSDPKAEQPAQLAH